MVTSNVGTESRWAWTEVDLGALDYNVKAFKKLLKPDTKMMAVVKADAYGHGAERCAFAALIAGADRFGVATVEEGIKLREAGIEVPIQLLSEPPVEAIAALIEYELIPAATTEEFLKELSREALLADKTALYHVAVNTGMNRIGFRPDDVVRVVLRAAALPHIKMEGIFTHFATADVAGDWDAQDAFSLFDQVVDSLRANDIDPGIVHCANTAATILMPETHFDMVRIGIGLYGLHPSRDTIKLLNLEPVMAIKARATLVKPIAMGEGVSYGLTWHAFERGSIATLPIGYADGLPRRLSNKMECLVGGKRVQQVGRICMDQFMCEIPASMEVHKGDEFVLVGKQGNEEISLDALADEAGTINYELACLLGSMRMQRVYIG